MVNTKTELKSQKITYLPEILQTSYFCFSLHFLVQNRGICCLKSVLIWKYQRKFLCAKILKNCIVNQNALDSECSLMHYKGRPSNYLF